MLVVGIKGKNTKLELVIRFALHRREFRFRLHRKDLPDKPDLVFTGRNAVFFMHGFLHGHECQLLRWPTIREAFRSDKINKNIEREQRQYRTLAETGLSIGAVWECALSDPSGSRWRSRSMRHMVKIKTTLEVSGDETRTTV